MDLIWTSAFLTVSISPFESLVRVLCMGLKSLEESALQGFWGRLWVKIVGYR